VLYRTNAQSRVIEDALMREGIAYRIVGGVRFYERKEIKDTLAYLRLLLNPHDDVSLRRVINVPPRGIGRGVLDALDRQRPAAPAVPLLAAAGAGPADPPPSLWTRLTRAIDEALVPGRAMASLTAFRDLVNGLAALVGTEPVSTLVGKVLDRTGYLEALRGENTAEAEGRIENLVELVSAAREHEAVEGDTAVAGFVDRLSLLSESDEESGTRSARLWMMTLHSAKGLEFPAVIMTGLEEGLFPHARAYEDPAALEEERRLCYVGMTRAASTLVLTGAARRRVFGDYVATEPSRFLDEIPPELVERIEPARTAASRYAREDNRARFGGRRAQAAARPQGKSFFDHACEDEDQSVAGGGARPGMRVRHPTFGVGTVVDVEDYHDDLKLTVRFASVGVKKLIGRYARLEPA
jgi:DNA helicase-2/ATP-dependent DNA helicase PcrA